MKKQAKQKKLSTAAKCFYFGAATLFITLAAAIVSAVIWATAKYGIITMDQIIFNITMPLKGTNTGLLLSGILCIGLPSVLVAALTIYVSWLISSKKAKEAKKKFKEKFNVKTTKLTKFLKKHLMGSCAMVLIIAIVFADLSLQIHQFVTHQMQDSQFIETQYVDPANTKITFPKKKRNIIYIFMESMETTCSSIENGGAMEENYIPELTKLAKRYQHFSNKDDALGGATQITGTAWTIASLISQTSGLPLKVSADGNVFTDSTEVMTPVTSLGDILEEQGYNQMLMVGSDATFGGRRQYFEGHGSYEIFDLYTAREEGKIPQDYSVWWGYEDAKLFEYAKEKITEMSKEEEPFNFSMLTVDTHHPSGYLCEECGDEFEQGYSNVYACSSRQLYEFVKWIKKQEFYENTTIILSGDHLSMSADYFNGISSEYQRTPLNIIINSAAKVKDDEVFENRTFSVLDFFPTTLASIGVKIEGERLALGTNLYSGEPTLLEKAYPEFGQKEEQTTTDFVNAELSKNSKFYNDLLK